MGISSLATTINTLESIRLMMAQNSESYYYYYFAMIEIISVNSLTVNTFTEII